MGLGAAPGDDPAASDARNVRDPIRGSPTLAGARRESRGLSALERPRGPRGSLMRIAIVSPAGPGSRTGNRTTTLRWARILRGLGHTVRLGQAWDGRPCDLLVALHALKCHDSVRRYRLSHPSAPLVVALGGTDLYRDLHRSGKARLSVEMADRLIVLHGLAGRRLPLGARRKVRVIHQSVNGPWRVGTRVPRCAPNGIEVGAGQGAARSEEELRGGAGAAGGSGGRDGAAWRRSSRGSRSPAPARRAASPMYSRRGPRRTPLTVCVIGHLRSLKDPFRAAMASRLLPPESAIRIAQVGRALTDDMEHRARREERSNPRYRWLGDLPRARALRVLRRSRLMVISSLMEGGANVLCEASVFGVPALASRIDGNVSLLGADYPGYFSCGDTRALSRLLLRAERDPAYLRRLARACARRRPLFSEAKERAAWRALLREVSAEA